MNSFNLTCDYILRHPATNLIKYYNFLTNNDLRYYTIFKVPM